MDSINIIVLFVFLLNIFLLLVVHFRASPTKANLAFQATIVAIAGWCLSMVFYRASSINEAVFWARLLYFFPPFIPAGFLIFGLYFPNKRVKTSFVALISLSALLIGLLTLIPGMVINSLIPLGSGEKNILFGEFYWVYFSYIPIVFTACFLLFIKKLSGVSSSAKKQIWLILIGLVFATLPAMVTNLILPTYGYFTLNWVGQVFTSFWVMFVTYAIVKHKFIEVKVIVARAIVYSVLLIIFAFVYTSAVLWTSGYFFREYINTQQLILFACITLFIALTFQPLKRFLETVSDKIFFKNTYDPQELSASLTKTMATTLQIEDLTKRILITLLDAIKIEKGMVVLFNKQGIKLQVSEGFRGQPSLNYELLSSLTTKKDIMVSSQEEGKIKGLIESLEASVILPLYVRDNFHGALLLGDKKSGELYSEQDIDFLTIFGSEFSVAVQNALSYDEISRFNVTLKEEVEHATKDLKQANEKLKEVDKLKTEFVSLASHELRTPMTAIKSYLWMALKGKGGPLSDKQAYYLDRAYRSTDRLIKLVNDMLNISRIESGRISLDLESVDIQRLTRDVVEEVLPRAQELGISVEIHASSLLPRVLADGDKIKEVLINLIGNSLKFTPKGGQIQISFSVNTMVEVRVSDNGAGISSEDLPKLFQKFGLIQGSYTVNKTATQGTGLGLYICKSIVELHGGKIGVQSGGVGKGAVFSFTLPKFSKELLDRYKIQKNVKKVDTVGLVHTQV